MKTISEYLENFPEANAAQQAAKEGHAPLLDLTLHEYWAECQMVRQPENTPWALLGSLHDNVIDEETFHVCQRATSVDQSIPYPVRQKILRLTQTKAG